MNISNFDVFNNFTDTVIPLERRKIRVVYARNPPDAFDNCAVFPTMNPNLNCPFPGWTLEILTMILEYLDYDIVPIITSSPVGSVDWGTLRNGTWTGMLGYLFNESADVVCLLYQHTETRGEYYSYSYNIYNVKPIYTVKKLNNQLSASLWNAFRVYSVWIWLAMVATFVGQTLYSIFVAKVEWKMQLRTTWDPADIVWRFARLQLTQPEDFSFFSTSGNLTLMIFSIVQAKVMMTLYQALLLGAILRPPDTNPFKNADDMIKLIAAGEYKLITNYIGNWYFDDLTNSDDEHFRKLRAAVAGNPVVIAGSVDEALDLVELGGYIFPVQEDSLAMQMSKQRCGLTYVSDGLPEKEAYFAFKKNSTFLPEFNKAAIFQTNFIIRTYNKYFNLGYKIGELPKCPDDNSPILEQLSLITTFGVFLIVLIGLSFSILFFFAEIYFAWQHKMIKLRLKTRRAIAEPVHLMAVARMFGDFRTQKIIDERLATPTPDERKEHIQVAETGFM